MLHKVNLTKILSGLFLLFLFSNSISAHCDSVEGPVVQAAKKTLATGNLNYVLIWIQPDDEEEIKEMYNKVVNVRDINDEVRELTDMYFYETVVRVHRMSEGVGYAGLKFEEFKPAEGIAAAERAIERNSVEEILSHVDKKDKEHVKHYFSEIQSKKNYNINDVDAGREYVKAYVHFIHYVEELFGGETEHKASHKNEHSH